MFTDASRRSTLVGFAPTEHYCRTQHNVASSHFIHQWLPVPHFVMVTAFSGDFQKCALDMRSDLVPLIALCTLLKQLEQSTFEDNKFPLSMGQLSGAPAKSTLSYNRGMLHSLTT